MRRLMLIGGAAAALVAAACSDSSSGPKETSDWSGAVIKVAAENPSAHGELRGVVLDSAGADEPNTGTPIVGATVSINLKVQVPPATSGDTATTTVTMIGTVVTDEHGRFLVTDIPEGDYFLLATPPADAPYYDSWTWVFASSGSGQRDAVIFLPHKSIVPPDDSIPQNPGDPGHPIDPPIDSL